MTGKLEANAAEALRHRDLAWVMAEVPAGYRDNPAVIAKLLAVAAEADPSFAQSPAYHAAHAAATELGAERTLRDRMAAAYWNPEIRARFGEARVEAAWRDPETALVELRNLSVAGGLSPALNTALDTLYEVRQYATENNLSMGAAPAAAPIPTDPATADAERAALVQKSISGALSKAEDARLNALYEVQAARDAGAPLPSDKPAPPSERAALVQKSIAGKLSPDENARLDSLYVAEAIASGDMEAPEE